MISELKTAFQMGFLLFLPFLHTYTFCPFNIGMIACVGTIKASWISFNINVTSAKDPGKISPLSLGAIALIFNVLVDSSILGSTAKTVPVKVFSEPETVNFILSPLLTKPAYFSGMEKSILTGSISCRLAITLDELIKLPSLTYRSPITPSKGALISVLSICAFIKSRLALLTFRSLTAAS